MMTSFSMIDLLSLPHVATVNADALRRRAIKSISIDSRTMKPDDVFIAIEGERHDGHSFIPSVLKKKPLLVVVSKQWFEKNKSSVAKAPLFVVDDTTIALGDVARAYRRKFDIPVIVITGTNGKTTTKDMIASVLKTKYNLLATPKNYNNHIGLPLTLFKLSPSHKVAVLELGTNQPGDIEYLSSIAMHSHALITNIGRAHLEKLKTRDGIAREKGMIYKRLPQYGVAFLNADEPLIRKMAPPMTRKIYFGESGDADIQLLEVTLNHLARPYMFIRAPKYTKKTVECGLRIPGAHNAHNALAALTVGFVFHCPTSKMVDALQKYSAVEHRLEVRDHDGILILDDTYNANPDSMATAIDSLAAIGLRGKKIAVLGDMRELGAKSAEEHVRVGEYVAKKRIDVLLTIGTESERIARAAEKQTRVKHFTTKEDLVDALRFEAVKGDAVLIKGSHSMAMEEIVEAFMQPRAGGGKKR